MSIQQNRQNRPKKRFIPILTTAVALLAIVLIAVPIIKNTDIGANSTHTAQDYATLDHLDGEKIGNNSAMSAITNYVFMDTEIDGIALETKNEPYGVTVNVVSDVTAHLPLKYAVYVFSLIDNAQFIEVSSPAGTTTIERGELEQQANVQFSKVEGNDAILSTYHSIEATKVPQLQMSREDNYKVVFNAINSQPTSQVSDWLAKSQADFSFKFEGSTYLAWHEVQNADARYIIMNVDSPTTVQLVPGDDATNLYEQVSRDFELVTGTIIAINENQLNISIDNTDSINNYLVTVDNGENFEVGEVVTAWSTMMTMSLPPQSNATKILKK